MAKDDKRRKSFWDDDEEEDAGSLQPKRPGGPGTFGGATGVPGKSDKPLDSKDMDRLIQETRTLMEQTHQLYMMYLSGVERRPPIEKARLLESRVAEIQRTGSNVTATKFKISQFVALYNTTRELWERKLKEKEKK
jgi:hypothetical protein